MLGNRLATAMLITAGIIGIAALFIISMLSQPLQIQAGDISELHIGKNVIVCGYARDIERRQNLVRFSIGGRGYIDAVIFPPFPENTRLVREGAKISVEGKVKEYKSALEIVVEKVSYC